jgi:hypothetical protein
MSSIVIAGDTSGTCTLSANAVAGTTVLTLPTTSGVLYSTPTAGVINVASGGTGLATLTANNVLIGNGTGNVAFVAPGSSGNLLTSNGSAWTSTAPASSGFPSGTVMLFGQTAAPTGWTKNTTTGDNSALRVVTGTASTGGSVAFTTAFASQTPAGSVSITSVTGSAGATTLSTPQIPSHSHVGLTFNDGYPYTNWVNAKGNNTPSPRATSSTGGGGSHDHPFSFSSGSGTFSGTAINLAVQYIDVIRATKD